MDKEKLGLAQYLKNHPILSENDSYKVKYLNVLEHFVRKFSNEDIFAKEMLELYKVVKTTGTFLFCHLWC